MEAEAATNERTTITSSTTKGAAKGEARKERQRVKERPTMINEKKISKWHKDVFNNRNF